jgi:eukaryotic translation initiation factor 2C
MQSAHVMKAQEQYMSNVCMKINAKLGGSTSRAVGTTLAKIDKDFMKIPTMIIGADVSHAAPGVQDQGSMAAITCSMDSSFTRYSALCDTNGNRVEIISTQNIQRLLKRMTQQWMSNFRGVVPSRVIYYRDGVSSGQYQQVLDQEVEDMKDLFRVGLSCPILHIKLTV